MVRFAPERFGVQLTYRVLAHRALEQSAGNLQTYHFPTGPIFGCSGSGQNNNSVPKDDPDTLGHCPDTQPGFMQGKIYLAVRTL